MITERETYPWMERRVEISEMREVMIEREGERRL